MKKEPKILICPLNWGLGHATRMVPVIKKLVENNFDILIAASGDPLLYLKKEFTDLNIIDFPNYNVKYSESDSQLFRFLLAAPKILFYSVKEHFQLKKIIKENKINIVISDNRYGLWNSNAYSIFITHQLNIILPGFLRILQPIARLLVRLSIRKYNECWVPDRKGENNLAGSLSHKNNKIEKTFYIGALSRYNHVQVKEQVAKEFEILIILSGPEPQRTIFENMISEQVNNGKKRVAMVRGTTAKRNKPYPFPVYDIVESDLLLFLINSSEIVVCRSGYSSIMDLVALNKNAILVPTPGQTEQEYLSEYLKDKNLFYSVKQKNFNLESVLKNIFNINEKRFLENEDVLNKRILFLKEKQYY